MTPKESLQLLDELLRAGWFDPDRPSPAVAWEVFRDWVYRRVDCEHEHCLVSVGYAEDQNLAHLEFCRVFDDPRADCCGEIFLQFTSCRPDAPRLATAAEYSEEGEPPAQFFARVEELPGFTQALRYPRWEFAAGWE
jgi:hypothetical protein